MANPNKVGLVLGAMTGGGHAVWALLILIGWAQPLLDFIFWLHMINPVYTLQPFGWKRAIGLVVVTALVGYVVGRIGATVWNNVHRRLVS